MPVSSDPNLKHLGGIAAWTATSGDTTTADLFVQVRYSAAAAGRYSPNAAPQRAADLAQRRLGPDGRHDRRHQVAGAVGRRPQLGQAAPRPRRRRAAPAARASFSRCSASRCGGTSNRSGCGASSSTNALTPTITLSPDRDPLLRAIRLVLRSAAARHPARCTPPRRRIRSTSSSSAEPRRSSSSVSRSTYQSRPAGSTMSVTPISSAMHLLGAHRDALRLLGGNRDRLVVAGQRQRLHAAEHRGECLDRRADDVVLRLLRGQRRAARLRVRAQHQRAWIARTEPVAHDRGPHPAQRTVLGDLLEEVDVRVEDPREPRRELVDADAALDRRLARRRTRWRRRRPSPARPCFRPRACGSRTARSR